MGVFHFLNVLEGDCSMVQHPSGRVTVVDVNNAGGHAGTARSPLAKALELLRLGEAIQIGRNFGQAKQPVDPINYLREHGITSVHRFVLTHPDMDHMGGLQDFCRVFSPINFWDTENEEEKTFEGSGGKYSEEDWLYYKSIRDGKPNNDPKRLLLYDGARGQFFNVNEDGSSGADGLYVLAPTPELESAAKESGDCNEYSYVLLYRSEGGRILFCADSHDRTWEHILANHAADVADVDVMLAPHHGRDSDREYAFLDVTRPKLTLFGNAASEHLAYEQWSRRGLRVITNNQANCVVIETGQDPMQVYVTNETYAKSVKVDTWYSPTYRAWYIGAVGAL